jgi:hypothetical protein
MRHRLAACVDDASRRVTTADGPAHGGMRDPRSPRPAVWSGCRCWW